MQLRAFEGKPNSHVPNDSNDFDDGEHEFGLAIATDAKEVDHDDQEQEDSHPRGVRDIRVPKTNGDGSSYNFKRKDDEPLHRVTGGDARQHHSFRTTVRRVLDCTHFQPIANPHAGSKKRVENAENDPATGNNTAISPSAWTVQYSMTPIRPNAMSSEAGPPASRALPEPTKRPVPRLVSVSTLWRNMHSRLTD